ncbi:TetR family transcriptional regulator [Roseibium porphyridii]|uniref:TetR family transcriptional regulator n=1 Tax=Roseibium porphyridii TaxID=2866279 RepID=A0ABY8F7S5_9HYPH|nr:MULTISPECIES: TetR family transcriptional regulator [Stappiaceae]WFE91496.1 TetR family transcriptional regulator [Roseibium sp. KMA01]
MKKTDRRMLILDAVITLLAERGLDGVTHRAVDEVAKIPQGSTSYYYRRKPDLLNAACEYLAELLEKDCDELQVGFSERAASEGVDAAVEYVAEELADYTDGARHLFLARLELTLAAARQDYLAGAGEKLAQAARRPIAFFLKLISGGRTDVPIETCAGLIDGISLMYATNQGPKPSKEQIASIFRTVLGEK